MEAGNDPTGHGNSRREAGVNGCVWWNGCGGKSETKSGQPGYRSSGETILLEYGGVIILKTEILPQIDADSRR